MNKKIVGAALGALALSCAPALAGNDITYQLDMSADNVVGGGDTGASATGTITISPDMGMINFEIEYFNFTNAVSGWGIGQGGPGVGDSLNFSGNTGLPAGDGMYNGTGNISPATLNFIIGLGDGAFFVIRSGGFSNGAVRAQFGTEVPAPGAACVLGLAGIAASRRRR